MSLSPDHDMPAFEAELLRVMPAIKSKAATYFAKDREGNYVHPEARWGLLCFKLGGNYAVQRFECFLNR